VLAKIHIANFIEILKWNGVFKMTENELGQILKEMYRNAPHGYQVANIHLFGVKFASVINKNHFNVKNIVSFAELNPSYASEVSKGIKLSEYVSPKL